VIEKSRVSDQMEQRSRFKHRSRGERGRQVGGVTPPSGMCPKGGSLRKREVCPAGRKNAGVPSLKPQACQARICSADT